jgi:uncharacterized protein (DUF4415 family)
MDDRASRPDADNPEWTAENFARARPASELLPQFIGHQATDALMRRGRGRSTKPDRKINQILRLDSDVVEAYRREGPGWQTHVNACCASTCHGISNDRQDRR